MLNSIFPCNIHVGGTSSKDVELEAENNIALCVGDILYTWETRCYNADMHVISGAFNTTTKNYAKQTLVKADTQNAA